MHDVGVALDHHQLGHLDAARLADPAQVIAAQVHQHHVFGPLLGIGQQIRLKGPVFALVGAPGPGAGDRSQGGFDRTWPPWGAGIERIGLHHHLRAGADQVPAAEVEEGHIGGWVNHPQAAVELKGLPINPGFQALAQHQLEDIPGGDVLLGTHHGRLELVAAAVAAGVEVQVGAVVPIQGGNPGGQGLVHPLLQGRDPGQGGVVGPLGIPSGFTASREVGVGHGRDLAFHLVEDQQAVGQHPAAIGRVPLPSGMDGHARLDPADQFVTPKAKQLAHRGQARHGQGAVGGQHLAHQRKGVALVGLGAAVSPVLNRLVSAHGEGPEGVADHKAPAAHLLAPFHRLQQDAMA